MARVTRKSVADILSVDMKYDKLPIDIIVEALNQAGNSMYTNDMLKTAVMITSDKFEKVLAAKFESNQIKNYSHVFEPGTKNPLAKVNQLWQIAWASKSYGNLGSTAMITYTFRDSQRKVGLDDDQKAWDARGEGRPFTRHVFRKRAEILESGATVRVTPGGSRGQFLSNRENPEKASLAFSKGSGEGLHYQKTSMDIDFSAGKKSGKLMGSFSTLFNTWWLAFGNQSATTIARSYRRNFDYQIKRMQVLESRKMTISKKLDASNTSATSKRKAKAMLDQINRELKGLRRSISRNVI